MSRHQKLTEIAEGDPKVPNMFQDAENTKGWILKHFKLKTVRLNWFFFFLLLVANEINRFMTSKYFRKKWRSILVYGWVIYIHKQKNLRLFSLISPGRPIFPKYRKITWANCWVSCCCKFPTVRIKAFQCKHDKSTLLFLMATYFFPNTL